MDRRAKGITLEGNKVDSWELDKSSLSKVLVRSLRSEISQYKSQRQRGIALCMRARMSGIISDVFMTGRPFLTF
jgi:hypothetical protein